MSALLILAPFWLWGVAIHDTAADGKYVSLIYLSFSFPLGVFVFIRWIRRRYFHGIRDKPDIYFAYISAFLALLLAASAHEMLSSGDAYLETVWVLSLIGVIYGLFFHAYIVSCVYIARAYRERHEVIFEAKVRQLLASKLPLDIASIILDDYLIGVNNPDDRRKRRSRLFNESLSRLDLAEIEEQADERQRRISERSSRNSRASPSESRFAVQISSPQACSTARVGSWENHCESRHNEELEIFELNQPREDSEDNITESIGIETLSPVELRMLEKTQM